MAADDDIVICNPLRTPVGEFGKAFANVPVVDLASELIKELATRTGIGAGEVDDVVLGQCYPNGEAPALGRVAALDAGLGTSVPGMQVDRRCGSGLMAVLIAAMQVSSKACDVVIAGGAESMSQAEHYLLGLRQGIKDGGLPLMDRLGRGRETAGGKHHSIPGGMLRTAENLRREYGISREAQDLLALRSHQKWAAGAAAGKFNEEIVPVSVPRRRADPVVVTTDEHPRPDSSLDALARLRPVLVGSDPEATVTAGNASGQNDGAAACIVTTRAHARERGFDPMLRLVSFAVAGVEPERMGIGPVPAVQRVLKDARLDLGDLDLIELNEAFASQTLACLTELRIEPEDERLNPLGSGISLGHPVGATGARILATMAHELRRTHGRFALETMCIGGGQGLAAVFENADS
jgi:acetyl-CoA C-acetyltransferase